MIPSPPLLAHILFCYLARLAFDDLVFILLSPLPHMIFSLRPIFSGCDSAQITFRLWLGLPSSFPPGDDCICDLNNHITPFSSDFRSLREFDGKSSLYLTRSLLNDKRGIAAIISSGLPGPIFFGQRGNSTDDGRDFSEERMVV